MGVPGSRPTVGSAHPEAVRHHPRSKHVLAGLDQLADLVVYGTYPASAGVDAETHGTFRGCPLGRRGARRTWTARPGCGAVRKRSASPSTNASKLVRSRSHSRSSKEAKTFSRCCSRLMGRMIVVVGKENDLDYPRSMRFLLGGNKVK